MEANKKLKTKNICGKKKGIKISKKRRIVKSGGVNGNIKILTFLIQK